MSGTATEFTAAATARLDSYLGQVRAAVAASDLDADDIEADIREHVSAEFRSHTRPVSLVELERVLVALGPPTGWAPVPAAARRPVAFRPRELLTAAKRRAVGVVGTLWRGPEDWRLAYLCLIATVLAVPSMGLLLPVAYLLGRAAVALAAEKGQPLGARRWLVYPPIVIVCLPALLAVCLWPLMLAPLTYEVAVEPAEQFSERVADVRPDGTVTLRTEPAAVRDKTGKVIAHDHDWQLRNIGVRWYSGADVWHIDPDDQRQHELTVRALDRVPLRSGVLLSIFAALGGLLAWGLVLGLIGWQFPKTVAAVFFPLQSGDGTGASRLAVGCAAGFVVWVGFASRLVDVGGQWA